MKTPLTPTRVALLAFSVCWLTCVPALAQKGRPYVEVQGIYLANQGESLGQGGITAGWSLWGPLSAGLEGHIGGIDLSGEDYSIVRHYRYGGVWLGGTATLGKRWLLGGRLQAGPEWVDVALSGTAGSLGTVVQTDTRTRTFYGLQTHGGVAFLQGQLVVLAHVQWINLNNDLPPDTPDPVTVDEYNQSPVQLPLRLSVGWNFGQ